MEVMMASGDQVVPFGRNLEEMQRNLDRLKAGDGGGTSGGMEERVTRLEKNVDALAKDVSDIRADVATLKENVRHLPTKPWLFSTLAGMLTFLAVIVGVIVRFIPHA
jgi:hypothetical protein